MDTPEKKLKTQKQETELEDKSRKRSEKTSKVIHYHNDEPDPEVNMGNYNFTQMLFSFCVGFVCMFVLSVNEIQNFKGCPIPEPILYK